MLSGHLLRLPLRSLWTNLSDSPAPVFRDGMHL
jgi:hypothetical protein